MKKHIQLFNQLIILSLFFTITFLYGQARPHQPPTSPILKSINTIELNFGKKEFLNPILKFNQNSLNAGIFTYQIKIQTDSDKELNLEIENAMHDLQDFYYIRYKNGGYIGPIYSNELLPENKLRISGINPNEFIVEYNTIIQKIPVIPIISKISKNDYSIVKKESIKENYWKRTREEPTVLVTGFWPPTNEMIRHFSQSPDLNPNGWVGDNWEDRGYDVVGYFPQFENPDCSNCGMGYGDLEVDYQDTSEDFWRIIDDIKPVGIITFSRGFNNNSWELESNVSNWVTWVADYTQPYFPTPSPPDDSVPNNHNRGTALPITLIEEALDNSDIDVNCYIDQNGNSGQFLSEFMGYHGMWYHQSSLDTNWPCMLGGHIHVGGQLSTRAATDAAELTIEVVLGYLDELLVIPGDINYDHILNIQDVIILIGYILDNVEPNEDMLLVGDLNGDDILNVQDVILLTNIILNQD